VLSVFERLSKHTLAVQIVIADSLGFCAALFRSRTALAAENLFLRKQLALFQEREKKATRATAADRFVLAKLARFFDWRSVLVIVKPTTLVGWHRTAFRRFWRWKSRPVGRPRVSAEIRRLIRRMAAENPTWGEERIADELLLKLQIRLSPRSVGKYIQHQPRPRGSRDQRWSTFLRNHAHSVVACDFFISVTASFHILYVFVALEIGSRRLVHFNVTEHPTADWTMQQLREALPGDRDCKFLLHDRHKNFSASLDEEVESWGIHVLRSPVRMPTANAHCERLIGTIRRECLDYLIPLNSRHLRRILHKWVSHYNTGRPQRSLGPGIPDRIQLPCRLAAAPPGSVYHHASLPNRFSAACITSTDGQRPHEFHDRIFAEDRSGRYSRCNRFVPHEHARGVNRANRHLAGVL
jgi:putative transposase